MECKKLTNVVEAGIKKMHEEKAPSYLISDYVDEMGKGGAVLCHECEKYEKCKDECNW